MSTDSPQLFNYAPTLELLRSFLPSKAVLSEADAFKKVWRIYIYLKTIYGDGISLGEDQYINSPLAGSSTNSKFSFLDWVSQLNICLKHQSLLQIQPKSNKVTQHHNAEANLNLLQQLTIKDIWQTMFYNQIQQEQWLKSFQDFYRVDEIKIQELLELHPFDSQGCDFNNRTRAYRLDFQNNLANPELNQWLQPVFASNNKLTGNYYQVNSWLDLIPESLRQSDDSKTTNGFTSEYITNYELADFITRFTQGSQKRLLFAAEFITSANIKKSKYNAIINAIETNWQEINSVKPLRITYKKFQTSQAITTIIYPVIFYYIKRGTYLYAINDVAEFNYIWEGYRLDRILDVEILDWENPQIPENLRQLKDDDELPTPEEVEDSLDADVLGYAFWQDKKMMFVRFNLSHYSKYIQDTSRQDIFQEINLENLAEHRSMLEDFFNTREMSVIIKTLKAQHPKEQYVFCIAKFYAEDIDVFLRILTWGKNVKVILPLDLKNKIYTEIESALAVYQEN
ncbi:TIGR03985 family CRISPR-associated protein [Nostoc sp. FACHB-110]|uniref:TIGR03985 family CRISPR-associated protein n=1 Tax=Nostoc sp. FACHB-110 TaxID=2692834 RepID=UPI0016869214|nr:TIGR03985 family CRISPR-associated protein [Nostoc sp. FACHB-110]MBD2436234.1 TIGR03985 family CRISPR-associated protein [Nostoc sp. FACHB-110]